MVDKNIGKQKIIKLTIIVDEKKLILIILNRYTAKTKMDKIRIVNGTNGISHVKIIKNRAHKAKAHVFIKISKHIIILLFILALVFKIYLPLTIVR